MLRETSQSFLKTKLPTPWCDRTGCAWSISRPKKYAIRIRIATATPVRPHLRTWSGSREASGSRPITGRLPRAVTAPASTFSLERRPVALEPGDRGLRGRQHVRGQLRVLELGQDALSAPQPVVEERLDALRGVLGDPRLAHVLEHDHERLRRDRIGLRVGCVDDLDPEVGRDRDTRAGGCRRR